jgi:hypothetical protein
VDDASSRLPARQAADVTAFRAVAVLLGVLLGVAGGLLPGAESATEPAHAGTAVATRLADEPSVARSVLQRLLRHRAAAYASGDPAALSDVFVRGSPVLRRDQALLRAWSRRSLTVRGAVVLVRSVHVLAARPGRVVVRSVDRLGPVAAAWGNRIVALPRDQPSRHRIVLVRRDEAWRIAAVQALSG